MIVERDVARAIELTIGAADSGQRLDVALTARIDGISRATVQRWIRDGLVLVDGKRGKASTLVTHGVNISIAAPAPRATTVTPEPLPLRVIFEDDALAVIDKPAGMVVHPAAGHQSGTVVNALLHHFRTLSTVGGDARPGIVHRLDKGTSGLMVVAKTDRAHRDLARQFQERTVAKTYVALVWGRPSPGMVLDIPLGRDPRHRKKISGRAPRGRSAVTTIIEVEPYGEVALLRLTIGTGRTHQIRVHLSEAGFPVVGDELYGGRRARLAGRHQRLSKLDRPFLHAARLEFRHPLHGHAMTFEAPLAEDLQSLLVTLQSANATDPQGPSKA